MICLRQVSHFYLGSRGQKVAALEDINLTIPQGTFTAIIGPNSSGKSTLARILAGLVVPSCGQVLLEGMEIAQWDQNFLHKTIGLIFPHPDDQIVFPTVEEDLAFGLENLQFDSAVIGEKITDILQFLDLEEYRRFPVHQLSGGQKQKIAIAAMVILGLRYLILDEPTSFLDAAARREVFTLIQRIHQTGATIVYLSQFFEELTQADVIVALFKGRVEWQGSLLELLQEPNKMVRWGIEVPPIVKLVEALQASGLPITHPIYTVKQLMAALQKLSHEN